jgi:hypothetical protein
MKKNGESTSVAKPSTESDQAHSVAYTWNGCRWRYDFSDPDGKADNLFVFHRDVDKARLRLKKGDPPAAQ